MPIAAVSLSLPSNDPDPDLSPSPQIYRNALPPNPPNLTMTINDMYGFGDGNLAAGRMRVALYGTIERVEGDQEIEKCKHAYLQGN